MVDIYGQNERIKLRWRDQAQEDPLTGLPNLRALECYLRQDADFVISSLRIANLDFLSRHYGMMMGCIANSKLPANYGRCWGKG